MSDWIVIDDTLERGRWEKDENGRRYWRGPAPRPGQRVVLRSAAASLRQAASLMRQRAESAPAGERWVESDNAVWRVNNPANTSADALTHQFPIWADGAAEHIASWHPAVALAVADWLDAESHQPETEHEGGAYTTGGPSLMALRVARAYLGEPS